MTASGPRRGRVKGTGRRSACDRVCLRPKARAAQSELVVHEAPVSGSTSAAKQRFGDPFVPPLGLEPRPPGLQPSAQTIYARVGLRALVLCRYEHQIIQLSE